MLNWIIFAIVAYFLYSVYKSYRRFERIYYSKEGFKNFTIAKESIRRSELGLFVALMAKVAKADGRVHELEAELISNTIKDIAKLFPQSETVRGYLKEIFNEEKETIYNIDDIASALYMQTRRQRQKRETMMMFLIHLAFIDAVFSENEERIIYKIASFLHIEQNVLEAMIARFNTLGEAQNHTTLKEAYELLGIDENATLIEVKKAYRKAVKAYHPDLMKAQGKSDEYIAEATKTVQRINAAYETIKKVKS